MMLIKENLRLLHKHCQLATNEKDEHLYYLVDVDIKFLPPFSEQEEENIDVVQDDLFNLELNIFIPLHCNNFILLFQY